ncbi:lactate dehydrogenase (plasmid) [Pedobacter sp. BS3]|uniref:lactate dehydrogenase n=1 Tax=Pedobacter sp. BS3 TaxID=2567937 RepID=UPI0011EEDEBB|nr:lactate dehydrogenase [Pedobacter sp. BS3]TZF86070.1 lactate dehydrogenase [Pedobacter sp. BS3]
MKAVAYSITNFEKELLAKANQKKHDITLIANALGNETITYADGKDAVIVFNDSDISDEVIKKLAQLGVKCLITCSANANNNNHNILKQQNIAFTHIPVSNNGILADREYLQAIAFRIIENLDNWQGVARHVVAPR